MGAVKELVVSVTDASMTLIELQDSGVPFVLAASPDGWAWFIAPEGEEYLQEDWIFHALRRGLSPTFEAAVAALSAAVVALLPKAKYSLLRLV